MYNKKSTYHIYYFTILYLLHIIFFYNFFISLLIIELYNLINNLTSHTLIMYNFVN